MYLFLTKSLLPLFLLFSYVVVPVMAEEDHEVVGAPTANDQVDPYVNAKDGLCVVDKDFFAAHAEYDGLTQADVLTVGTQIDVTNTTLRLIPKDQRCSKEIKLENKNSCMVCHESPTADRPMVTITKPMTVTSKVQNKLLICPNGPGTCPGWMMSVGFADGLMLACNVNSNRNWGPSGDPMKDSLLLRLGIKMKVPCANLKAARSRDTRRPW